MLQIATMAVKPVAVVVAVAVVEETAIGDVIIRADRSCYLREMGEKSPKSLLVFHI